MPTILSDMLILVLILIADYRWVTALQLAILANKSPKRAQEYLITLFKAKMVRRIAYHPLTQKAGRACYVYAITRKGMKDLNLDTPHIKSVPSLPKLSPFQIPHILAVNNFRISLQRQCQAHSSFDLVAEAPEYRGLGLSLQDLETLPIVAGRTRGSSEDEMHFNLVPDLAFVLGKQEQRALLLTEIDRSTESFGILHEKLTTYHRFGKWQGWKIYEHHFGCSFHGFRLLLVGERKRLERLIHQATQTQDLSFVFYSDTKQVEEQGPLSPIWSTPGRDGNTHTFWEA